LAFIIGFRARESTIIFDSVISSRISRNCSEDSKGLIGPGVFGVILNISRTNIEGGADFWGYEAVLEEEDNSESSII
jgi:hypothetical protein